MHFINHIGWIIISGIYLPIFSLISYLLGQQHVSTLDCYCCLELRFEKKSIYDLFQFARFPRSPSRQASKCRDSAWRIFLPSNTKTLQFARASWVVIKCLFYRHDTQASRRRTSLSEAPILLKGQSSTKNIFSPNVEEDLEGCS